MLKAMAQFIGRRWEGMGKDLGEGCLVQTSAERGVRSLDPVVHSALSKGGRAIILVCLDLRLCQSSHARSWSEIKSGQ